MKKKKATPITGIYRDKLIIALQMEDIIAGINLAMRVRKLSLTLDYSTDHFPRLYIEMPNTPKQLIMKLDPQKHCCYMSLPRDRDLFFAFNDIQERLGKLGGRLSLTGDRPKQGPRRALLQVYVEGATQIALTLMDATKGNVTVDTSFQLPDGTTP